MRKHLPSFAACALAAALAGCGADGASGSDPGGTSDEPVPEAGVPDAEAEEAAPAPPVTIRVVDWNVHDFFDTVQDGAEKVLSEADFQAKVGAVGAVLARLDGDVVVLAEVESTRVLDALADGPLAGRGYDARVLLPGNDERGIHVAALSRRPFAKVVSHRSDFFAKQGTTDPTYRYSRDCLELHLDLDGHALALLGVHFKAKAAPDDPDKRLAEAQHTRGIAQALRDNYPGIAVMVLGDFNDEPGSPPVDAVLSGGPGAPFVDAPTSALGAAAWSYEYQGEKQLIDHQVGDPGLAAGLDPASVDVPHDAPVGEASDHAPIAASWTLR